MCENKIKNLEGKIKQKLRLYFDIDNVTLFKDNFNCEYCVIITLNYKNSIKQFKFIETVENIELNSNEMIRVLIAKITVRL